MKQIALAMPASVAHLERVAAGIREHAQAHPDWRFVLNPEAHDLPPAALRGWRGAGVIALCNTVEDIRVLKSLRCPVVNLSGALRHSIFPRVRNDYREIGRRAATFLRRRGFQRYGFYGVAGLWYSSEIEAGFHDDLVRHGLAVEVLRSPKSIGRILRWDHHEEDLYGWLRALQTPCAVLGLHDSRAAMVVAACERAGLRVPEDVAVMGVNDDPTVCETCRPSLTSLGRNDYAVGRQAAAMMERLMAGEQASEETIVPPGEIHERESTRTYAIAEPALAAAVRFLESSYARPISVEQVAQASRKSRRWLEDAFREQFGVSPYEFLKRRRVRAAVDLFDENRALPLSHLVVECGFSDTRQLNAAFKKEMGISARAYLVRQEEAAGRRGFIAAASRRRGQFKV